jgi:integrase
MEAPTCARPDAGTRSRRIPKLGRHRASGQWRVVLDARSYYLGIDRTEARKRYDALIAQWLPTRSLPAAAAVAVAPTVLKVGDVAAKFTDAHKTYFCDPDGKPTGELDNFDRAFEPLLDLYGKLPAEQFSPKRLKEVQAAMVARGWCRSSVNHNLRRVKRLFKWATGEELVPASVYHGLQAVDGLRRHRSAAPEPDPVEPVPEKAYLAALPHLRPMVRAMVELQYLTGMRVSEVRRMHTGEVDRSGAVWLYRPLHHKTSHFGRSRAVALGPKAQAVLTPWLKLDPEAPIFSPKLSERERRKRRREARKTRVQPSQVLRNELRAATADARKRPPGDVYNVQGYRCAIRRACKKAGVEEWAPARLRHNAAERIRREFGVEVARCYLGHADIRTTQLYSSMDEAKAMEGEDAIRSKFPRSTFYRQRKQLAGAGVAWQRTDTADAAGAPDPMEGLTLRRSDPRRCGETIEEARAMVAAAARSKPEGD